MPPLQEVFDLINAADPVRHETDFVFLAGSIISRLRDAGASENQIKNYLPILAPLEFLIHPASDSSWQSYFGPRSHGSTNEEYPKLSELGPDTLDDWIYLANNLQSVPVKARFADAVWEVGRRVASSRKDLYTFGRLAATLYIEAGANQVSAVDFMLYLQALNRGISLSITFGESELVNRGAKLMMDFADAAEPKDMGFWAAPFDNLIRSKGLAEQTKEEILKRYELRFEETLRNGDLFRMMMTGSALAKYFADHLEFDRAKEIALKYGETVLEISEGLTASLATHHIENILETYRHYGLREDANRVRLLLEARGKDVKAEMKLREFAVQQDRAQMEEKFSRILDVDDAFVALYRLANACCPKAERISEQLKNGPFIVHRIMPVRLLGDDGLPVATVETYDNDPQGHLILQLAREMTLCAPLFVEGMEQWKKKFKLNSVLEIADFLSCPLIPADRIIAYQEGLKAFERGDYMTCIHTLVPQIEQSLRELLRLLGIPLTKSDRMGGFEQKNMNDVLHEEIVRESLEENLWYFLKTLYSEKRGLNLRNEVVHGIAHPETFNQFNAALLVQSICLLAVVRQEAVSLPEDFAIGV